MSDDTEPQPQPPLTLADLRRQLATLDELHERARKFQLHGIAESLWLGWHSWKEELLLGIEVLESDAAARAEGPGEGVGP